MALETDKIRKNQNIYDFCIWKYGSLDYLPKLVADNQLYYDSEPEVGTELVTDNTFGDKKVTDSFKEQKITPTGYIADDVVDVGIGEMAIGTTFIIR